LYKDQHKCPAKIKEVKRDLRHKEYLGHRVKISGKAIKCMTGTIVAIAHII
jgi:hypothetical protein